MTRMIFFTIALVILTAASRAATTYYVDAKRPDDSGDGLSWATAKQTIQAAVDLTTDGDTVLVAKGKYDRGTRVTPWGTAGVLNRVAITNRISLVGVDGPKKTVIFGSPDPVSRGCGSDAVRGVFLFGGGTICGLTITEGYTMWTGGQHKLDRQGGAVMLYRGTMSNCIIQASGSYSGGGAYCLWSSVSDCFFDRNSAYYGGGLFNDGSFVSDCTLTKNVATNGGGAYLMYDGTFDSCKIQKNRARYGGGMRGQSGLIAGCTVTRNRAEMGGGLDGRDLASCITATNCIVKGNHAWSAGGGAAFSRLLGCLIKGNKTKNGIGGGAYDCALSYCTIAGNVADIGAGLSGLDVSSDFSYATNCIISHNRASSWGGGAAFSRVYGCLVTKNRARKGGGVYCSKQWSCTVAGNIARTAGGVCKTKATNCIVWGNKAKTADDVGDSELAYSCVPSPAAGAVRTTGDDGCIGTDPLFVDAKKGDYHLQSGSPCINTGTNLPWMTSATDLDGNPRVANDTVDMGCYEYHGAQ